MKGGFNMTIKYGYSEEDWNTAKEEMMQILVGRAKLKDTISYSELVAQVQTIHLAPDSHALAAMLGEISSAENAAGRGMLSVLVVHKDGDMQPGPGFFDLAKSLGRNTGRVPLKFWIEELNRVYAVPRI